MDKAQYIALLQYDDSRAARRLLVRRRLFTGLIAAGVAKLLVLAAGDRAWDAALSQFWQMRCMSYELPADRITYLAGPIGIEVPPYLVDFSGASRLTWDGSVAAAPYPVEFAELQRLTAPPCGVAWETLPAPVFLHGLDDSSGRRRLVTVYALANNPPGWWTLMAVAREPVGLLGNRNPAVLSTACWPMPNSGSDSLTVFAGQGDASDRTRFTIRIIINGNAQIITGCLRDNATIDFKSDSGLQPWDTPRAGALVRPVFPASQFETCDNVLLPTD